MPHRDTVSWNTMVAGYAQNGQVEEALDVFEKMPERNTISWNALIAGYAQNGCSDEALELFQKMQVAGVKPDSKTFGSVLPTCANLGALDQGREIHGRIITSEFQYDFVVQSALADVYAKCGILEDARKLFDKMCQRDVVSWTAMITGYAQNGYSVEALNLFKEMKLAGVKPDCKTFAGVLPACAKLASLEQGMEIHEEITGSGFQSDVIVANALIDMYAKCGSIIKAHHLFDNMPQRNVVSWTTMIGGYAMHGFGKEALKIFEKMQHSGMKPNRATLVCVLSACCHAGLVDEGWLYFNCMTQHYHITPTMEHYGCMVDLFGRAGLLDEAQNFINKMPVEPNAVVWSCLLGACRKHNNVELGEYVAGRLFELDPENATPYVVMSNMYASACRWDDADNVRRSMKDRGVRKIPGWSWIEVDKQVHTFLAEDMSHPQTQEIYALLEILSRQMKTAGYVPDTGSIYDV
jgi:pentatricopeptide repeat protein